MQRSKYSPKSPVLHHPVPQHRVTVPVMQSPPPPPSSNSYGSPYDAAYGNHAAAAPPGAPLYPGWNPGGGDTFFADPTTQMGLSVGKAAFSAGQDYFDQNVKSWLPYTTLKPYFAVTNAYVARKLILVLFPWRHTPWSRSSTIRPSPTPGGPPESFYLPPREDLNAPDMYIPLMSFVTYILLSCLLSGLSGHFDPAQLGYTAFNAFVVVLFEIGGLRLGCYLLNIENGSQVLDLVAYSGYKFVGIIVTIAVEALVGGWARSLVWSAFGYTFAANAFFLLRSLKYVLLPDPNNSNNNNNRAPQAPLTRSDHHYQKNTRTWLLFGYSYIVQFLFMWLLTSGVDGTKSSSGAGASSSSA